MIITETLLRYGFATFSSAPKSTTDVHFSYTQELFSTIKLKGLIVANDFIKAFASLALGQT